MNITEADRQSEIERIHTEAVGDVLMRVCQLLDGIRYEIAVKRNS